MSATWVMYGALWLLYLLMVIRLISGSMLVPMVLYTYQPYNEFRLQDFRLILHSARVIASCWISIRSSSTRMVFGDGIAIVGCRPSRMTVSDPVLSYVSLSSQHYMTELEDRDSIGIKSVKGYFLLNRGDFVSGSSSSTTLKLMFIENIKLVRMHARKPVTPENPSASGDSASTHSPIM